MRGCLPSVISRREGAFGIRSDERGGPDSAGGIFTELTENVLTRFEPQEQARTDCPHLDSNQGPADYEGDLVGRRSETFSGRRLFLCPPVPPVSTVSVLLRRVCVEFGAQPVIRAPTRSGS